MTHVSRWLASLAAVAALHAGVRADDKKADDKTTPPDPKEVRVGPPPELAELRKAVEEAARKGENVEEIRKHLEALEKALAGKAWVKPKPVEEEPPPRARPLPEFPRPDGRPRGQLPENLLKAQELMLKAATLRAEDPAEAERLMKQARELLGANAGGLLIPPRIDVRPLPFPVAGRGGSRLGIRVEDVPEAMFERFKLPDDNGILAAEIVPDSPAEKAGLQVGDVLLEFAGKPVGTDAAAFVRRVQAMKPGDKVDIVYVRRGKKEEAKGVVLADVNRIDPERPFPVPIPPRIPNDNIRPVQNNTRTIQFDNDQFRLGAEEDGIRIAVNGTVKDGKLVPAKIAVTEGRRTVDAESVEKLPAEYRDLVKKILDEAKSQK